ncbi:MAG: hypothetical protein ACWA5Q_09125 [bacterium]
MISAKILFTSLLILICTIALATPAIAKKAPKSDHYSPDKPVSNPDYLAKDDPNHPLKNPNDDPHHDWDTNQRNDGTPPVKQAEGDWHWGELFFEQTYPTELIVTNNCKDTQQVQIFLYELPYLNMPRTLRIPGGGKVRVPVQIVTPQEPGPPMPAPGSNVLPPANWGWVPPPPPQPGVVAQFHQPFYEDVSGELVIWHPWSDRCEPKRETFKTTGHIHFLPPRDEQDTGPQRIAKPDVCEVYWNLGKPPPDLGDKDCTEEIRKLASHFVSKLLAPWVDQSPDKWRWLPHSSAIQNMSIKQLLAMKARAESTIGGWSSDPTDLIDQGDR